MGRRRLRKSSASGPVRIPFQQIVISAMTAGSFQLAVSPPNFGVLAEIYTGYSLYKFTRLEYQLLPRLNGTTDSSITLAYYPDATVTAPGSVNAAMENLDAIIQMDAATVPTKWHKVPPSRLKGLIPWYKCQPDASASDFEQQGTLQFFGTSTEATYGLVRGVCEFKNPVDSSTAMKRIKDRVRAELKAELYQQALALNSSDFSGDGRTVSVVKQTAPSLSRM